MSDLQKITEEQMNAVGVCSAPDVLSGSTSENKAVFDKMVRQLVAPAYNAAVDAINAINQTESGIQAAEEQRSQAEAARSDAEQSRAEAEAARAAAELARAAAEAARQLAETAREDLETGYVSQAREAAEAARKSAEDAAAIAGGDFATKVKGAVEGNLASLDQSGNLKDSGKRPDAFADKEHSHQKEDIQNFNHASTHRTGGGDALTPKDIGACTAPVAVSVTLTVSGWSSASSCWTQTVACTGLLTTDNQSTVMVLPGGSSDADARILIDEAYAAVAGPGGKFECGSDGQLTATGPKGGDKPTVDLPLIVCIAR